VVAPAGTAFGEARSGRRLSGLLDEPLASTLQRLANGTITSAALVDRCLAAIDDPAGEGTRTFIRRFTETARAAATASDALRASGAVLPPLAGIPFSIKDLTDVAGSTTTAGSIALRSAPPAPADATYLTRLRAAGAIVLGTTNMTEFAMGGLGLNPHYGTPRNPYDRAAGRIPGGSSSGAAISITDGMASMAIGTDTAGSVRMPAALCGIAGFKPTARRVPLAGTVPLAESLDSIGPIGRTVSCCAYVDGILAGDDVPSVPAPAGLAGLRFALPQTLVLDGIDDMVAAAFEAALRTLRDAGAHIVEVPFAELGELAALNARGGFPVAEGYAWHRTLLESKAAEYDPIIGSRFALGANVGAADYIDMVHARASLIERSAAITAPYDAVLMPTVPIVAPLIASFDGDTERWLQTNRLLIRNPGIANILDRCALSIPCHARGSAPVGLTLMGETMGDQRLLSLGLAVEAALVRN
jgi:aspartyl-tRNA(Asn)/glutamyl-tRNA(Gln) amidotransferase subunit A